MKELVEKFLKPEFVLLCLGFVMGLVFIIINPPFQSPDEDAHFYKIYGFTEGSFAYKKLTVGNLRYVGHIVPASIAEIKSEFHYLQHFSAEKTGINQVLSVKNLKLDKENKVFSVISPTGYTIFSYIPFVVVVKVLKAFNCSPFYMIYILRFCSLLVYLSMSYFAVKTTPVKKWLFTALALMPMSVYMGASINTDCITIGVSFLLFAYLLKLYFADGAEKYEKKQIFILSFLFTYLFICKSAYLPLIILFFILRKEKISNKNRFLAMAVVALISLVIAKYIMYVVSLSKGCNLFLQFHPYTSEELVNMIVNKPVPFLFALLKTPFVLFKYTLTTFVGTFGWLDTYIPMGYTYLYALTILFFSVFSFSEEKVLNCNAKILLFTSSLFTYAAVAFACYLVFFVYSNGAICGIQGRYYIPYALTFFLLFQNKRLILKNSSLWTILYILICIIVYIICIMSIIHRYYV